MRRLALILVCVAGVVFMTSCRKGGAADGGGARKIKIAVIPKGTTHIFWQSVHAGAKKAAEEFGVEIEWIGPERESDREKQIQIVDDCNCKKVDGVVLARTMPAAGAFGGEGDGEGYSVCNYRFGRRYG